jgi:hypothetical protein
MVSQVNARGLPLVEERVALYEQQGDHAWAARVRQRLAVAHAELGHVERARALTQESLEQATAVADALGNSPRLHHLGDIELAQSTSTLPLDCSSRAPASHSKQATTSRAAYRHGEADLALQSRDPIAARRLYREALDTTHRRLGLQFSTRGEWESARVDESLFVPSVRDEKSSRTYPLECERTAQSRIGASSGPPG